MALNLFLPINCRKPSFPRISFCDQNFRIILNRIKDMATCKGCFSEIRHLKNPSSLESYVHIMIFALQITFTGSFHSTRASRTVYFPFFVMMKYECRAAVVASFSAGKKPAEAIFEFRFKKTMAMDIWRKWKACENKEDFTAERKAQAVQS